MDILARIREKTERCSKGQRAIGRYILASYEKAAFLTAQKLGKAVGVSESTVVRFAAELGYEGYPAMQKALQELVLSRLTSVQRIEVAHERFGGQDVLEGVLQQDIDKIRETMETVDRDAFGRAVDAILNAKRIYILGARSSSTIAHFLHYYLNYMFDNVRLVDAASPGEMLEQLARVEEGDAVIAVSYPRYSHSSVQAAEFCRKNNASVIAITDSARSPMARYADHLLEAKMDMVSLMDSLVAPLSLANALLVAIGSRRERELARTFAHLEQIWDEYEVYEKIEN